MGNFDYISSLASAAVYEHASKFYERDRLINIYDQLRAEPFDASKPHLPNSYIHQLSSDEKKHAISELENQIDATKNTPACDALRKEGWMPITEWSSVARGIGVERGFYAVPFFLVNGNICEMIIAFRGSDNVFNWVDNLREFSKIDLWPAITNAVQALKTDTVPDINIAAMHTNISLPDLVAYYTEGIRKLIRNDVHLRFTGHSLGGYLSLCESLRTGLPAITFENPGFPHELTKNGFQHCQQNIREFLSEPNAVNTMGYHAGQIFLIPMHTSSPGYMFNGHIYHQNAEKFGPMSLRISGLSYLINLSTQSLNPIAKSTMLSRFNRQMTGLGYTMAWVGGSTLAFCLLADLISSSQNMAATQQFFRYSALGGGHLIWNGTQQLVNNIVEQGSEYLPHYLPFMANTAKSHSMSSMIDRAFTSSGTARNFFTVLYHDQKACWPNANTSDCQLTATHIKLNYVLTGKALAVVSNVNHQLYPEIRDRLWTLFNKQQEFSQDIEQKNALLEDIKNKLFQEKNIFSIHQRNRKHNLEKLSKAEKDLVFLCQHRAEKEHSCKNYKYQDDRYYQDYYTAQAKVDYIKKIRFKNDEERISLNNALNIARDERNIKLNKYKDNSDKLEQSKKDYEAAKNQVLDTKPLIEFLKTKIEQDSSDAEKASSKINSLDRRSSEMKRKVQESRERLGKVNLEINKIIALVNDLDQSHLGKLSLFSERNASASSAPTPMENGFDQSSH